MICVVLNLEVTAFEAEKGKTNDGKQFHRLSEFIIFFFYYYYLYLALLSKYCIGPIVQIMGKNLILPVYSYFSFSWYGGR